MAMAILPFWVFINIFFSVLLETQHVWSKIGFLERLSQWQYGVSKCLPLLSPSVLKTQHGWSKLRILEKLSMVMAWWYALSKYSPNEFQLFAYNVLALGSYITKISLTLFYMFDTTAFGTCTSTIQGLILHRWDQIHIFLVLSVFFSFFWMHFPL